MRCNAFGEHVTRRLERLSLPTEITYKYTIPSRREMTKRSNLWSQTNGILAEWTKIRSDNCIRYILTYGSEVLQRLFQRWRTYGCGWTFMQHVLKFASRDLLSCICWVHRWCTMSTTCSAENTSKYRFSVILLRPLLPPLPYPYTNNPIYTRLLRKAARSVWKIARIKKALIVPPSLHNSQIKPFPTEQ